MSQTVHKRLIELGIELPVPPAPVASYIPFVIHGQSIYVSGQVPMGPDGPKYIGKLGTDFTVEEGQAAARLCALNIVAQLSVALDGDLDRITRIVRLGGFVNCADNFTKQPLVINGASNLMEEIFGEMGRHARAAVGVNSLPVGVAVEIDAIAAFK